jgi:hypothetical protein
MKANAIRNHMRNEEKCNQLEKKTTTTMTTTTMIERVREKKASFSKRKYHHRFIINKKTAVMTLREGQRKAELSDMMMT